MELFVKGDVVVIPFPFSDLSTTKRRPALVIAESGRQDVILCQITSQTVFDDFSISLSHADFQNGTLRTQSHIRPNKIFTAEKSLIIYKIGTLNNEKKLQVIEKLIEIFS